MTTVPRGSFLLVSPRHDGVEYAINPWREGNVGRADRARAAGHVERLRRLGDADGANPASGGVAC